MKFIDTHIHLQDFTSEKIKDIITSSDNYGLDKMLCVSAKPSDWKRLEELADEYKNIIPAFGVHPWYVKEAKNSWLDDLRFFVEKNPQALIGEIGLDGYKDKTGQEDFFKQQLLLAVEYSRPIVIHSVKAQNWFENNWQLLPDKFVFHSYNGSKDFLKEVINHNAYVSFSFSILANKDFAELVNIVPLHRLLAETDSPYQALEKNAINSPFLLPDLIFELAKVRKIEQNQFTKQVYNNSLEFMKVG